MGWETAGPATSQSQIFSGLDKYLQDQARKEAFGAPAGSDKELAPESTAQRLWDVTKEGVTKIPEGFRHSLDPSHILPNVGMGVAIGAATKFLLPAGGPVGKVAGGLLATYFVGKPMFDSYNAAYHARTMADMHRAADMWGDTVGGLPLGMVEGGIGAYIGGGLAGRAMGLRAMEPYVNWKNAQYAKLDTWIDHGVTSTRNFAYDRFGLGGPVMRAGTRTGFVPPYLLEDLARNNPNNPDFRNTMRQTEALQVTARGKGLAQETVVQNMQGGLREVYDAQGKEITGVKVRSEGQPKTGNTDVDNVYDFTGDVRDYYRQVHNRNSIDGKGMKMESTVNYGQNYENAFWDGSRMTYGKPGPDSPFKSFVLRDVTGHEITHGVTEFEAGLVYRNQPGALNESLSDVFGALVVQRVRGQTASEASWLVGEGIWKEGVQGRALRDMQNPGTAYNDPAIGKDPQPAHMKDYNRTRGDNGGVHYNSGIPNRAFVTFAQDVGGFAWERPGQIWYKARGLAGSQPSFAQFAAQTIEAAKQLGYTDLVPKLEKAWDGVGIKPSLTDKGMLEAPIPIMTDIDQKRTTVPPITR